MVERAFCELFVAGCLELQRCSVDGELRRYYRAREDLDLSLLDRVERVVVRCLRVFTGYDELLDRAARELADERQLELPGCHRHHPDMEIGDLIDEALEYHPPACSCSV